MDRVLSLAPYLTGGSGSRANGGSHFDEDAIAGEYSFKSGEVGSRAGFAGSPSSYLSPKAATLFGSKADDGMDVSKWDANITRLRESRARPFWGVALTTYVLCVFVLLVSGLLLQAFYRQDTLVEALGVASASQSAVTESGTYCMLSVAAMVLLHALAVYRLSADLGSSHRTGGDAKASTILLVRFTDFALKVAFVLVLTTLALTLRYWDNEPSVTRDPTLLDNLTVPRRSWVLGLLGITGVLLGGMMVVGASLPYRPSYQIFASSLRTFGLFAFLSSFAAAVLAMVTVIKAPATFFQDLSVWAPLGLDLMAGLGAVALAGSAHSARSTMDLGAGGSWLGILTSLTAALGLGAILSYSDAVPEFELPLVISNPLFASAICAFTAASQLALAAVHLAAWRLSETVEPARLVDIGKDYDL